VGALILDTSVLIGLLDSADAHHARAVQDTEAADISQRRLVAPATAYSEALVAFARAGRTTEARGAISGMGINVAPLTEGMAERAAELRSQHVRLRLPDAMVLACAAELDGELLTYDARLAAIAPRAS